MDGLEAESTHLIETWTFRESGKPKNPSTSTNFKEIFQFLFPEKKWEDWPNIPFLEGLSDSPKDVGKHRRFFFFSKKTGLCGGSSGLHRCLDGMIWGGSVDCWFSSEGPTQTLPPSFCKKSLFKAFFFRESNGWEVVGKSELRKTVEKAAEDTSESTWSVS